MQIIVNAQGRYIAISQFSEKDTVKEAGFRWNPKAKHWYTDDPLTAAKLRIHMDPEAQAHIDHALQKQETTRQASRAATADPTLQIPAPPGLSYLEYQKVGIQYAMQRPATLIADEMGLGKTIQAIGLINADPTMEKILVVCPASLRINWKRELEKWLVREQRVEIAVGKHWPWPTPHIVVINYDILGKHMERIHKIKWDCLIVDECHYLKNPQAQRTRAVFGHRGRGKDKTPAIEARTRLFLTGTPIVNRPKEIQPILASINPDEYGNFFRFAIRYCDAHKNDFGHWDFSGASNLDELQDKLRSTCMVRRLKADVLTELPPKRRQVIELPADGAAKEVSAEQTAWQAHQKLTRNLREAIELAKASDDIEEHREAVRNLKKAARVSFQSLSEVRRRTAMAKVPYVAAHIREALDAGTDKIVLFAHHHSVIDALIGEFAGSVVKLDGRDSMQDRDIAVQEFQAPGGPQVFVGGIHAAGVGLTLTAAAHVVFAELDWVPGNMSQAEDRCHRIGQNESVLVQHIVLEHSIDAHMAQTVIQKQEVIDQALDTKHAPQPIEQITAPNRTVDPPASPAARKTGPTAETIGQEEIDRVHRDLKTLSDLCDGAQAVDGYGFNKFDSDTGKKLAGQDELTQQQAALGKRITRKYHRQLALFPDQREGKA